MTLHSNIVLVICLLSDTACLVMFKVHFIVSHGQFVNESLLSFIYLMVSRGSGQCASSQFCEKFRKILVKFMSSCDNFEISRYPQAYFLHV